MPIYDFECLKCYRIFEKLVKMSTKEQDCERCGSKCAKVETPVITNFVLKGEGWYKNDNKKESK